MLLWQRYCEQWVIFIQDGQHDTETKTKKKPDENVSTNEISNKKTWQKLLIKIGLTFLFS